MTSSLKTVRETPAKWDEVLLVCRKCGKKLDGGFGDDRSSRLDRILRKALKQVDRSRVKLVSVSCLKVCPKGAVTVVRGSNPGSVYLVAAGADASDALDALGFKE
jgi:predicted metal-binding protein